MLFPRLFVVTTIEIARRVRIVTHPFIGVLFAKKKKLFNWQAICYLSGKARRTILQCPKQLKHLTIQFCKFIGLLKLIALLGSQLPHQSVTSVEYKLDDFRHYLEKRYAKMCYKVEFYDVL